MVLVSCIIYFKVVQFWLQQFSLNFNACKVMTAFFEFWHRVYA